jgi:CheY-like chemotaxis protein
MVGKKNPVTGERFVSRESLMGFMRQHDLPIDRLESDRRRILLASPDENLLLLEGIFSGDTRVEIKRITFGGDVLILCSKERPDLLILDENLPDLSCGEVVKSLRRAEETKDLPILCHSKTPDDRRCTECGADGSLLRGTVDRGHLGRRLYSVLALSEEVPREQESYEHRRRRPRVNLHLPAKIKIYPLRTPQVRQDGEALLENISGGGAFLSNLQVEKGVIPCEPFRIVLEVDAGPLKNWRAHCRVVRLEYNGSMAAAVEFMRLSRKMVSMVMAIVLPADQRLQSTQETPRPFLSSETV